MNTNGVWTDEKVEQLRKLRAEGHSFGQISLRLKMSRSSCLGKAYRLRLKTITPSKPVKKPPPLMPPWKHPDPKNPEHKHDAEDLAILDACMTGALPGAIAKQFGVSESYVRELWRVREAQEPVGEEA